MYSVYVRRYSLKWFWSSNADLFANITKYTDTHDCILRTYAGIPKNGFGLPILDYLRT